MKTVIYRPGKCAVRSPKRLNFTGGNWRVALVAGANHLSDEQIANLNSSPDLARYIQWGAIEIVEPVEEIEEPAGAVNYPPDLTGYNIDDAEVIIEETWDSSILTQWRARDTRKGIFSAIDSRLEQIAGGNG